MIVGRLEVKIIQFMAMENTEHWQGHVLGLGDDGVVYISRHPAMDSGWIVYMKDNSIDKWERVMSKKTDKYFVWCPQNGFTTHETFKEAQAEGGGCVKAYLDYTWDTEVADVVMGKITHTTEMVNKQEPVGELNEDRMDEAGEYWAHDIDHKCNYELLPIKTITPTKGEPMPRTIEYYKKRGDADQELILKQSVEIGKLTGTINDLRQKLNRRG